MTKTATVGAVAAPAKGDSNSAAARPLNQFSLFFTSFNFRISYYPLLVMAMAALFSPLNIKNLKWISEFYEILFWIFVVLRRDFTVQGATNHEVRRTSATNSASDCLSAKKSADDGGSSLKCQRKYIRGGRMRRAERRMEEERQWLL